VSTTTTDSDNTKTGDLIPVISLISPRHQDSWMFTRKGDARGYIDSDRLDELWIHTGTACNLACPFCLEGSKPGDTRLPAMSLEMLKPFIHEAVDMGVKQFSFTGGEPFVIRDFANILDYASQFRPCFVLTNGTRVLTQRAHQLLPRKSNPFPVSFRISLDYPDAARHDIGRGEGSFKESLDSLKWLLDNGFKVSIARQMELQEDSIAVERAYHDLFVQHGITQELPFTAFPDFGTPGTDDGSPEVTTACMEKYPTQQSRSHFMCTYTRMLVNTGKGVRVYACTLVDDDPDYDLGATLAESMQARIMLRHHRCFSCYKFGASCSAPA
jgi:sulfatase maturation enzyme AslB (radical SAM superfamily)